MTACGFVTVHYHGTHLRPDVLDLVMTACGVKNKKDITVFTVMSFLFFLQKKFKIYAVLKILNRYLFKNK